MHIYIYIYIYAHVYDGRTIGAQGAHAPSSCVFPPHFVQGAFEKFLFNT